MYVPDDDIGLVVGFIIGSVALVICTLIGVRIAHVEESRPLQIGLKIVYNKGLYRPVQEEDPGLATQLIGENNASA